MHDRLFEAALGIEPPWSVVGVRFDEAGKVPTVGFDFTAGSGFAVDGATGDHPVHDTVTKTYRHLNFFQHECVLEVRTPRVKLPDGSVRLVKPPFAGKLSGFTLLFEALVLMLAPEDAVCSRGAHRGHLWAGDERERPSGLPERGASADRLRVVAAEQRGSKTKKKLEIDPLHADPVRRI